MKLLSIVEVMELKRKLRTCKIQIHIENKCSVGPETSISPRGKGQGPTSFSERGLFFSEIGQLSDRATLGLTVQIEEKNSPLEEKEEAETFSIEGILVSCPTDTFFLPLKRHDPNHAIMKR